MSTSDQLKVAPDLSVAPNKAFLLPSLAPLQVQSPHQPRYDTPLGKYFEPEWIKGAKQVRRMAMTEPPKGISLEDVDGDRDVGKPLDFADWENDIVMCSLQVLLRWIHANSR